MAPATPHTRPRSALFGESRQGDITYRVRIALDRQDARLRWNMTAAVTIEQRAAADQATPEVPVPGERYGGGGG